MKLPHDSVSGTLLGGIGLTILLVILLRGIVPLGGG